jgi:hypothetical protein
MMGLAHGTQRVCHAVIGIGVLMWAAAYFHVLGRLGAPALERHVLDYAWVWVLLAVFGAAIAQKMAERKSTPPDGAWNRARWHDDLRSVAYIAGGLFVASHAVRAVHDGRASSHWPSAPAQLIEAEERRSRGGSRLVVRYTYTVDGQPYESDRVWFGTSLLDTASARLRKELLHELRSSALVARYDPIRPARAVLKPGVQNGTLVFLGIGVAILYGGASTLIKRRCWIDSGRGDD